MDKAIEAGLSAIALTDHNTIDGLPDFLEAARGKPIEAIPGIEFTVQWQGKELHLLGLFIKQEYYPAVTEKLQKMIRQRAERNIRLVGDLSEAGYPMEYEAILRRSANGKLNRVHIAAEMVEKGYVPSIMDALKGILSPEAGFYKEPLRLDIWDALAFLLSIGAVPVLAHPFLNLTEEELRIFLPEAKKRGLVGMETVYSTYDEATSATAAAMAREYALLPSGGSDFHGSNKPDIQLGIGRGNLFVPHEWADKLKECIQ